MSGKNKNNNGINSYIFTKETLGITLLLFGGIVLLMLLTRSAVFAGIGTAVCTFMYGTFGYGAYGVIFLIACAGVYLAFGKRIKIQFLKALTISLTVFALFLLIHSITSNTISTESYGSYLSGCYTRAAEGWSGYTFGGVISAIFVYPIAAPTNFIGAYIVFSLLAVLFGYLTFFIYHREAVKSRVIRDTDYSESDIDEEPRTDEQPVQQPQVQTTYPDDQSQQAAFANAQPQPPQQPEPQPQQPEPQQQPEEPAYWSVNPYDYNTYEEDVDRDGRELGKRILFENGEFAAESYKRNMIYNSDSYFYHPVTNGREDYLSSFSADGTRAVPEKSYSEAYKDDVMANNQTFNPTNYVYGENPVSEITDNDAAGNAPNGITYSELNQPQTDGGNIGFNAEPTYNPDYNADSNYNNYNNPPAPVEEPPVFNVPEENVYISNNDDTVFEPVEDAGNESLPFGGEDIPENFEQPPRPISDERGRAPENFEQQPRPISDERSRAPENFEQQPRPISDERGRIPENFEQSPRPISDERSRAPENFEQHPRPISDERGRIPENFEQQPRPISDERGRASENFEQQPRPINDERGRAPENDARRAESRRGEEGYNAEFFEENGDDLFPMRPLGGSDEPDNNTTRSENIGFSERAERTERTERTDFTQHTEEGRQPELPRESEGKNSGSSDLPPRLPDLGSGRGDRHQEKPAEPAPAPEPAPEPPKPHVWKKYVRPTIELLDDYPENNNVDTGEIEDNKRIIVETLKKFKIESSISNVTVGPAITRYDVKIADQTNINRIKTFRDPIAMALKKDNINIVANFSRGAYTIEVPNTKRSIVGLKGMLVSQQFLNSKPGSLTFALGKGVDGEIVCPDITKMPHLLVAGTTGSGKSICLSAILISLLYKYGPEELRLILVDPKQVEFIPYDKLPHLMVNEILHDVNSAIKALKWAVDEMDRRYTLFRTMTESGIATKNLEEYNSHLTEGQEKLPKILIILDEFGDLMLQAKKEIENRIIKLAQKARACGIHLILATQRPSVDCITGLIKSNLPSRIGFKVNSIADSNTIFDLSGAEKLLGKGDLYFRSSDSPDLKRIQCCFVDTHEVQKVTDYVKANNETYFDQTVKDYFDKEESEEEATGSAGGGGGGSADGGDEHERKIDETYIKALKFCITANQASVSMIQRQFPVGYIKACKIIDWMTNMSYITPAEGSKPRKVMMTMDEFIETFGDDDD